MTRERGRLSRRVMGGLAATLIVILAACSPAAGNSSSSSPAPATARASASRPAGASAAVSRLIGCMSSHGVMITAPYTRAHLHAQLAGVPATKWRAAAQACRPYITALDGPAGQHS